ncbi:MAG: hypothetical protein JXA87_12740 [Thermoleophilia bacterium]|nr:hypothetical protein [Thermoleophilia bacterium]
MVCERSAISVTLRLQPLLARYVSCSATDEPVDLSLASGTTIETLLRERCGLAPDIPVFVTLRGRTVALGTELHDGDVLGVFLAVGGG